MASPARWHQTIGRLIGCAERLACRCTNVHYGYNGHIKSTETCHHESHDSPREASPRTTVAVERCIIAEIESLPPFPERIRESDRAPGARELVANKLPYVVFVQVREDAIVVLNVTHTARKFPD